MNDLVVEREAMMVACPHCGGYTKGPGFAFFHFIGCPVPAYPRMTPTDDSHPYWLKMLRRRKRDDDAA